MEKLGFTQSLEVVSILRNFKNPVEKNLDKNTSLLLGQLGSKYYLYEHVKDKGGGLVTKDGLTKDQMSKFVEEYIYMKISPQENDYFKKVDNLIKSLNERKI